ncbi:VIP peptides-like [Pteropus medius]|uniref:VIP peptides-like n=1 Tax=Pteropus vampyrus TaxID=132908 RepID=UPI00196AB21F|nr:VIP peptides-like [Pteropus giganteus]
METRGKPQLLMSLIILSMLFSQMLAWPLFEARFLRVPLEEESEVDRTSFKADTDISRNVFPENGRSARHANEIVTSDLSRVLDHLSDKLEVFTEKRDLDNIAENWGQRKRQSDAILTDLYVQHLRRIAARKYLEEVLKNKKKE